jgi:hypothetical protein
MLKGNPMLAVKLTGATARVRLNGKPTSRSFFRGEHANFHPTDESLQQDGFVARYLAGNLMPARPFITKATNIVAFGSCFAANISKYLTARGYNVTTSRDDIAYVARMGDGIVNTFAIRQQFEWAWQNRSPQAALWHSYDADEMRYDEAVRLRTRALFDEADVFIITLGLSEVWYDEPTGEVFWRAVPVDRYDPARHKFRVTTAAENLANLHAIRALIRQHRPEATVVVTLSPIPLVATFRDIPCIVANSVSKAILRAAVDEFHRDCQAQNDRVFYFPSYEIVLNAFNHSFSEDRRHVYGHVLNFNMRVFERYFCDTGLTDAELNAAWIAARDKDVQVGRFGHKAVATGSTGELRREVRRNARMRERMEVRRAEGRAAQLGGTRRTDGGEAT